MTSAAPMSKTHSIAVFAALRTGCGAVVASGTGSTGVRGSVGLRGWSSTIRQVAVRTAASENRKTVERPDPQEHAPDDVLLADEVGGEETRVAGVGSIVTHHPVGLGRNLDGGEAGTGAISLRKVRLVQNLAVDVDAAVGAALDGLARKRDHALHQVLDRRVDVRWRLEDDDVTAMDRVQVVREPVDDDPVVRLEGRHHRVGRNVERLEQKGL